MQSVFITGTNTGVGKTLVTAAIVKSLQLRKIYSIFMKPIATGCKNIKGNLISEDVIFLSKIINQDYNNKLLKNINPVKYKLPLAPYSAQTIGEKTFKIKEIKKSYNYLIKNFDFVVAEGIGGIAVPLKKNYYVYDLIKYLKLPVIIVAENKLGVLNEVILSVSKCNSKSIKVLGIILNQNTLKKYLSQKSNKKVIEKLTNLPVLIEIPFIRNILIKNNFNNFVNYFDENFKWGKLLQ